MLKAELLRKTISEQVPWLRENPDQLVVYVQKGNAISTGARSASFEYRYTLMVLAMDYPHSIDTLMVPILMWARIYQPDLLLNPERRKTGITFEADLLSNSTADLLIRIQADEAVIVTRNEAGEINVRHRADPPPDPMEGQDAWGLLVKDEMANTVIHDSTAG
ncbi:phage tail protein [Pectobacterium carotovorum]|uniref:Phage tail protein n=1 Tax=Pectobacterium parvum TaxID=2778550 RepID=A0AAP9IJ76_9GAMM|nr:MULTISPECIES: phage tail protein [Pectobacterium]MCA6969238.1 phage tail protein [Pectobacterium carotovorum]POE18449.1 phage tail protein [Pectobacterium odoriferum]QHQ26376.1 phage tail protein [Pectobacterium parvum]TAI96498.1 phage tail protein [Pectobacterium versatile]UEQ07700.1 phage tail protein [Pectobacterium versatile]